MSSIDPLPFCLIEPAPAIRRPVVFDSPHSGRVYPSDFNPSCSLSVLQKTEDHYIDDLFAHVPDDGATLLCAHFARCYIDANRSADDIDPDLLASPWPEPLDYQGRAHAGNGLIRRLVRPGVPIYNRKLAPAEIHHRLDTYYWPYHRALDQIIKDLHYAYGTVFHINCHSMPSLAAVTREKGRLPIGSSVDFVLGDRDGTTSRRDFIEGLRDVLTGRGYKVAMNDPYKGVEILRRHGNPSRGVNSVQLEINKALYMDEASGERSSNYNRLKSDLQILTEWIEAFSDRDQMPMAAD